MEKSAYLLQKEIKILLLQQALLEILSEKGIKICQIPQHLKNKVFFTFNL